MRILMIGGAGHVGGLVLPWLTAAHEIRILDPRPPSHGVEHIAGDAADPAVLAEAMRDVDVVVHMAMGRPGEGGPDPVSAFDVNVSSVYHTLSAAHRAGIRHAVHISSLSVFRDCVERRLDESTPPDATDVYGLTKRLGEEASRAAVTEWGMSVTVLRLAFPTSEDAWPAWALPNTPPLLNRLSDGTLLPALAAGDLARAMLAALEHRNGFDVFHVLGDDSGRFWDVRKARDVLGWRPLRR